MYLKAVRNDGLALQFITDAKKFTRICVSAVKQNGLALQYVPEKHKSIKNCLIAVINNKNAATYIPSSILGKVLPLSKWGSNTRWVQVKHKVESILGECHKISKDIN